MDIKEIDAGIVDRKKAEGIRRLFCLNQNIRTTFGGPRFTKTIEWELHNARKFEEGTLSQSRKRFRLGFDGCDEDGRVYAYMTLSVVQGARPTAYEREYILHDHTSEFVSGVFIRRILVHPGYRQSGAGSSLFQKAKDLATRFGVPLYCDINENNASMKVFAHINDGSLLFTWNTPRGTPMVRYAWT